MRNKTLMVVLCQQEQQTAALTKRNHLPSISEKGKGKRAKLSLKETSHGSTNTVTQGNCSENGPICDKGQSKAGRGRGRRNCKTQQGGGRLTQGMLNGSTVQENGTSKDSAAYHKTAFKLSLSQCRSKYSRSRGSICHGNFKSRSCKFEAVSFCKLCG